MMGKKTKTYTFYYIFYLLLTWTLYRFLFQFPDTLEELLVKPLIWLLPLYFLIKKEKKSLSSIGITKKNLFKGIYFALALGAVFAIEALAANFAKYGGFNFSANIGDKAILISLGLSFATAFSEEISFRGYIFTRLWERTKNEFLANFVMSIFWALVHIPVVVFVWGLSLQAGLVYLLLTTLFGVGSAFIYARTKNVFSSIFLHVLWEWPIILFR
jgi:membrane protease YdiL (CAAX protease family)